MKQLLIMTFAVWFLVGCGTDGEVTVEAPQAGAYVVMDSDNSDIPYPNDILFAPNSASTDDAGDGTLNIPYEPVDSDASLKEALNVLDGFSTTAPISVSFTGEVNASTLPGNVHLYKVVATDSNATHPVPMVVGFEAELTFGVDYFATLNGSKIVILPLKPLASSSNYMVVLTNGIVDDAGYPLAPDVATSLLLSADALIDGEGNPTVDMTLEDALQIEGLRQLTQLMIAQAEAQGVTREEIVMTWSFATQSIGEVQAALAGSSMQAQLGLAPTGGTTQTFVPSLAGIADVYFGSLSNLPQYMPQASAANPLPALQGRFGFETGSSLPLIEANVTIPAVATVPNGCGAEPAAGWPVIIYQHGITRQRSDLLAYAETFAANCYAAIAIDLPLHGITETNTSINPFYMAGIERTFDIDVVTEDADFNIIAEVPDGIIDSTGAHYMNLLSLLTTRDNMRQTTSDLLQLESALGSALGVKFDTTHVHFVSHSLGTIASIGYLDHTTALQTATLAMPGQGIMQLLNNSAVFGPTLEAGLAAKGVIKGTSEYESFLVAAQTVIDDTDPANYALSIGAKPLPMLFFEAIGNGSDGSGDQHIPNAVATAPLTGTDPFLMLVGAVDIDAAVPGFVIPATTKTATRLTEGEHRSPLDPQYSPAATVEIHTQMASFIGSNAAAILVTDPTVIKQ